MAKVFGPALSARASGKISPGYLFKCMKQWYSFTTYRQRMNRLPNTSVASYGQLEDYYQRNPRFRQQQEYFKEAKKQIKALSPEDKALWKEYAKKYVSHDSCSYTTAHVTYEVVVMAYALLSIATGGMLSKTPGGLGAAEHNLMAVTQSAKQAAGRSWLQKIF